MVRFLEHSLHSRDTWNNRQVWPWRTKWSRTKPNTVLSREHTGHSKHPLRTTQNKTPHMDITRRPTLKSSWLYTLQPKLEKFYTVSKNKTRSWLWLRSWTPCCQIQTEIEESREKHKTPFRYDVNQISYDYTVEVTNRFKGLDLKECLKNYARRFITLYRRWWSKPSSRKRNGKGKVVVWGHLTNSWEKKRSERQKRKGKIYPFEYRVPKKSKEG